MTKTRHITLLLLPDVFYASPIIRGVADYAHDVRNWKLTVLRTERNVFSFLASQNRVDGIIAHIPETSLRQKLRRLHIPVVSLIDNAASFLFSTVGLDNEAIGRLAADHLLSLGYRRFGFYGGDRDWSRSREASFVGRLRAAGYECLTTASTKNERKRPDWATATSRAFCARWVRRLQPPAAVLGANDALALNVIDAGRRLGWRVPEDLGVVGVDNNELDCIYGPVSLSSVDTNLERVGHEAASLLHTLLLGQKPPAQMVKVAPKEIVSRQSTSALAIQDSDVTSAVRFIRDHACEGVDIPDVLKQVPLSRRVLERRFQEILGRSPGDEIRRVRLEKAKRLLTETGLSMVQIALACGFSSISYLSRACKQELGLSPRAIRAGHWRAYRSA